MELFYDDLLINVTQLIKDRFSFITIRTDEKPKSTACTHYFSIDDQLVYESFFNDFGPLNISMLYHYCMKVNKKLKSTVLQKKRIVHYTTYDEQKRANAAYLAASYAIIYLNFTPDRILELLHMNNSVPFVDFRDASMGLPYTISLNDCLNAIYKSYNLGFFNFDDFDFLEYEHYERVENGDLNWIVPGKFIGFCGPHNRSRIDGGYPLHSPETYFSYFRRFNVTTIIRLNKKMYDATKFAKAGFYHKDLYFIDGSTPSDRIVNQFITICEKTDGAVAVHCKAGLGRTGSLIGCYIMKHYKFTAREAIAWIRMCRPGSVIGHQQIWLESKEAQLWKAGDEYRAKMNITEPVKHKTGIYSCNLIESLNLTKQSPKKNDVSGILQQVDTMQLNDKKDEPTIEEEEEKEEPVTQGDRLNQIKAQRRQRQVLQHVPLNSEKKLFRTRVLVSPLDTSSVLRGGKVIGLGVKGATASTSRVLTKRNGTNEKQVALRRTSQRKINSTTNRSGSVATVQTRVTGGFHRNAAAKKVISATVVIDVDEPTNTSSNETVVEVKATKRGKRCLNLEKEKASPPRSVKVLKRSVLQSSINVEITEKIVLPVVNKKK